MFELSNTSIKAAKELRGLLIAVGSTSVIIGGASLFLFPLTISIQSNTGLMLRYLALGVGLISGGLLVGIGFKLRSIKPLLYAAEKVENVLNVNQLASAQIYHQQQLQQQLEQSLKIANNAHNQKPEPDFEPCTEPEPQKHNHAIPVSSESERSEPFSEPSPEPDSEPVEVDVEVAPEFDKETLHSDLSKEELEAFIFYYLQRGIQNKQALINLLWGDIKKGGSKDYKRASEKLSQAAEILEIETRWS